MAAAEGELPPLVGRVRRLRRSGEWGMVFSELHNSDLLFRGADGPALAKGDFVLFEYFVDGEGLPSARKARKVAPEEIVRQQNLLAPTYLQFGRSMSQVPDIGAAPRSSDGGAGAGSAASADGRGAAGGPEAAAAAAGRPAGGAGGSGANARGSASMAPQQEVAGAPEPQPPVAAPPRLDAPHRAPPPPPALPPPPPSHPAPAGLEVFSQQPGLGVAPYAAVGHQGLAPHYPYGGGADDRGFPLFAGAWPQTSCGVSADASGGDGAGGQPISIAEHAIPAQKLLVEPPPMLQPPLNVKSIVASLKACVQLTQPAQTLMSGKDGLCMHLGRDFGENLRMTHNAALHELATAEEAQDESSQVTASVALWDQQQHWWAGGWGAQTSVEHQMSPHLGAVGPAAYGDAVGLYAPSTSVS